MTQKPLPEPRGESIVVQDVGRTEVRSIQETSSEAVAAQAKASIQAKYGLALHHPRDLMVTREGILRDCKRPRFAEAAIYSKPVGGQNIEGPSIRFVESALRHYRNVLVENPILYDDQEKKIVRVTVTDLESNVGFSKDITVRKTVERRFLRKGQTAISQRVNSNGQVVYTVEATDDDVLNKENALASKAIRNAGLRLLPADIVEEAVERVRETLSSAASEDPDREKKRIADAFAALGIGVQDLQDYLGHDLRTVSPAEVVELKSVYTGIRDGEATWVEILEGRRGEGTRAGKAGSGSQEPPGDPKGPPRDLGDLKRKIASQNGSQEAEPARKTSGRGRKPKEEPKAEPEAPKDTAPAGSPEEDFASWVASCVRLGQVSEETVRRLLGVSVSGIGSAEVEFDFETLEALATLLRVDRDEVLRRYYGSEE